MQDVLIAIGLIAFAIVFVIAAYKSVAKLAAQDYNKV